MLEQNEITRLLNAIQPINVLKIDGKFFNAEDVSQFLANHGYTADELDLIDEKADIFDEDAFEDYLNREESEVHIMGYEYEAGRALRAIDESDFESAYEDYCSDNLNEFNFHGKAVYYTEKELEKVTGKRPLFGYSINRRLDDHKVLPGTPVLPTQPTIGGV